MKKRFFGILATVLSLIVSVTGLFGCKLITTDPDRDAKQVVATVDIIRKDEITKMDVMVGYLDFGFTYEYYYGYTKAKALQLVLDTLVENSVMYQTAVLDFESGKAPFENAVVNSDEAKYSADRYLTEKEIVEAEYYVRKLMESYLHSYLENHEHGAGDTAIGEVRTVPTNATNDTEESYEDKKEYVKEPFDIDSTPEQSDSYNRVIEYFDANGVLGEEFNGDLESTSFYKNTLQTKKENTVLENYQKKINVHAVQGLTFEKLNDEYLLAKEKQEDFNNTEFVNALTNATAESPILYSAFGTYGYVYNLLLGVNDIQKAQVEGITLDEETKEYQIERNRILSSIMVKDLRDSWINAGYDFDFESKKFTGDYTFAKDSNNSLAFQGEVVHLNAEHEGEHEYTPEYRAESTDMTLNEFLAFMDNYVYGESVTAQTNSNLDVYRQVKYTGNVAEYDAKINELLFAFSTDAGSLNTYKGYLIKPEVEGSNQEQYVDSFAKAGRELLEMGGCSYMVVASVHGYHVMFFSEVFKADYGFDSLIEYLNATEGDLDWASEFEKIKNKADDAIEDSFLNVLANKLISVIEANAYAKTRTEKLNKYVHSNEKKVTFHLTIEQLFALQ